MNESKISVRYAKALFSLVKEEQSLEIHRKDIEMLYQCIREIPELQFTIHSPVIKVSDKVRIFREAFGASFQPLTLSFIDLVLENRREEYLAGICRYFLRLIRAEQGIRTAELVTAVPLDDTLRQSIIRIIAKKYHCAVELHEKVDESIIGGFILRVDDQQMDASISSKLNRIKNELLQVQS